MSSVKRKPVASNRSRSHTLSKPPETDFAYLPIQLEATSNGPAPKLTVETNSNPPLPITGLGLQIPATANLGAKEGERGIIATSTGVRRKPVAEDPNSAHSASTIIEDQESPETTDPPPDMSLQPPFRGHNPMNLRLSNMEDMEDGSFKPMPSPRGKISSFFGWKGQNPGHHSNTTSFSESSGPRSSLPPPSPGQVVRSSSYPATLMDGPKPLKRIVSGPLPSPGLSGSFDSSSLASMITVLEEELRQISAELAASIKREMDLEDTVDQLQMDQSLNNGVNRRTSDYFSDEGTSTIRLPADPESKQNAFDKMQRKMEQEKAQARLDFNDKIQEERRRCRSLEFYIADLEERAGKPDDDSRLDGHSDGRVRELETALEDSRRRAAEERQAKENYEDLLFALRSEVDNHRNERDNLRNEVIPHLRARVEGLEIAAAASHKLTNENSRLSQEIHTMKKSPSIDTSAVNLRINAIAEETSPGPIQKRNRDSMSPLTRSNSTRGLNRSGSIKDRDHKDASGQDRMQDIKAQRDALHKALKNLLDRQDVHAKLTAKMMKQLEHERDQALKGMPAVPRHHLHHHHKHNNSNRKGPIRLNSEDQWLRRRAEEVLEPGFQRKAEMRTLKGDQSWPQGPSSPS